MVRRGVGSALAALLGLFQPGLLRAQANGPAEVLSREDLQRTGRSNLPEILQSLIPSFNLTHPSIAGGTDHVPPLTLLGMGTDQVLVLLDGKRRHQSALVHVNQTIGRGQGMVDLQAIPVSAIERIEIWRDGGAARFGFGAVAGVINIVLRSRAPNELQGLFAVRTAGDGATAQTGAGYGVAWGKDGFVRVTAELSSRDGTNRALPDRRLQYFPGDPRNGDPALNNRVTHRFGDPESRVAAAFVNAAKPLRTDVEAYGVAGLSRRGGKAGELWRRPSEDGTVRAIYPNGFLPLLAPTIQDGSILAGLRGTLWHWHWDVSVGYGRSSVRYEAEHTANASLGAQSPTEFYAGTLRADQFTTGLELTRRIASRGMPPLQLSLGGSHRSEGFQLQSGELDSYRFGAVPIADGPHAGGIAPLGAQGFPGFRPSDANTARRGSLAGSGELATVLLRRLSLALAGRFEHFRQHGTLGAYQLSGLLSPVSGLELRGSLGSGVRIPSLAQSWFSATTTSVVGIFGFENRTVPPSDPLAAALGAHALRPEHSRNLVAGAALTFVKGLSLSADHFRITVRDRIILSGTFDDARIRDYLAQAGFPGIGTVRFFSNALTTRTTGFNAAAAYQLGIGLTRLRLSAAWHRTTTHITRVDSIPGILAQYQDIFFDRVERARIERGQPRDNLILATRLGRKSWSFELRAQRSGGVLSLGPDGSLDQAFGSEWIGAVKVSYQHREPLTLTFGVENLLNGYPDRNNRGDASVEGNSHFGMLPYSNLAPLGFSGRLLYARVSWKR